jgi:signal transduction protein with GAF and PtsI domain
MADDTLPPLEAPEYEERVSGISRATMESIAKVRENTASFAARVRLIEDQLGNIRSHIELIDSSLIEKHKAVVTEIRDLEQESRQLRAEIERLDDLIGRTVKRLEGLATKEEVKVLERYIELLQPMNYVTRTELKNIIKKVIKEEKVGGDDATE